MVNRLLLLMGSDIPFSKARLTIHQPTMKEISYIGEEAFFVGCELLNFSKNNLSDEDKNRLKDIDDFDIFMSILKDKKTMSLQKDRISAKLVLSLIFPDYQIQLTQDSMIFSKEEDSDSTGAINKDNFDDFKSIIIQMFCLESKNSSLDYSPQGRQAKAIADKLKQGRAAAAKARGEDKKEISVFNRYISILAIGQFLSFEELSHYTVYQLFDSFERFELKQDFDFNMQARLAGAKNIEDAPNWMKDLNEKEE